MVEAMACGTPVIATRLGSVPEVVAHGRSGFVVDDLDGAVAAVGRLAELARADCRADVEERFSVDRMVDGYLEVYRAVLD
jgi:glycosyltransferase involved in cell wall biosynthesis